MQCLIRNTVIIVTLYFLASVSGQNHILQEVCHLFNRLVRLITSSMGSDQYQRMLTNTAE